MDGWYSVTGDRLEFVCDSVTVWNFCDSMNQTHHRFTETETELLTLFSNSHLKCYRPPITPIINIHVALGTRKKGERK